MTFSKALFAGQLGPLSAAGLTLAVAGATRPAPPPEPTTAVSSVPC